jgi:hypothetical protein
VGSDPFKKGELAKLTDRLAEFRSYDIGKDKLRSICGAIHKNCLLEKGCRVNDTPLERFEEAVSYFGRKIDNTKLVSSERMRSMLAPMAGAWYSSSQKAPSSLLTLQACVEYTKPPVDARSSQDTSIYSPEGLRVKLRTTNAQSLPRGQR